MTTLSAIKRAAIGVGGYRLLRWLLDHVLRRERLRSMRADTLFLSGIIPAGALCFDVGANVGDKSEAMWRAGAAVVAFEPLPECAAEIRARFPSQASVRVVQAAMGSEDGLGVMHLARWTTMASFVPGWAGPDDAKQDLPVPVLTFDAARHALGMPYFCKIDVEGWELELMKGMSEMPRVVCFEFHRDSANLAQTAACIERLASLAPIELNISPAESFHLHLASWMRADEFLHWLRDDLPSSVDFGYGDIFARRTD
jgi:FkbM family methyltransferase